MDDFVLFSEKTLDRRHLSGEISFHTWQNGLSHLRKFREFLETTRGSGLLPFGELDALVFQEYKRFCLREGNNVSTVNRKLLPLRLALQEAVREVLADAGVLQAPESGYLLTKKGMYGLSGMEDDEGNSPVKFLTDSQMDRLLVYYKSLPPGSRKDKLDLFLFSFHACGLRVSDIMTLEWRHIDWKERTLSKVMVKTRNRLVIPLSSPALEILDRWKRRGLNSRFAFNLLPEDFGFRDDGLLERTIDARNKAIRGTLNAVGRHLGFPFPLGMHVARHTFAVKALNSSRLDVHLISRLLGHSSVTVTEKVYATFLLPTLSSEVRSRLSFPEFGPSNG